MEFTPLSELYGNLLHTMPPTMETVPVEEQRIVIEPHQCPTPPPCPEIPTLTRNIIDLVAFGLLGTFIILAMDITSQMRSR
jgi:hypothetical protein